MTINFNDLQSITFDGTVYNEVTKSADNTSAVTQEKSNVSYDNFLLHSSKEWLSTIQNVSSEIVKEVKNTSDKVKGDKKVIDASKKSAPDSAPFKETSTKIEEGVKDLSSNMAAMADITNYTGAINFVSSTAVNTFTGSIVNVSDMGTLNRSPSITNTSNVVVNNAATSINYSDTIFKKTDRDVTVTNQQLLSASDKHNLVTNTTSSTSTNNKTAAVDTHEVITTEQKQYSSNLTTLTANSTLIGSKGTTNVVSQGDIVIGSGQTNIQSATSQASTNLDTTNQLLNGKITILSTGDIKTLSNGTISNQADTVGSVANKIGHNCIDYATNSINTTILSQTQSVLSSEGITYTGNRHVGISINPFGILAGTGVAPLIPFLVGELPPIIIDIPELPQFPFGDLGDFLSKCLPFASITNPSVTTTDLNTDNPPLEDLLLTLEEDETPLINLEDPLVVQNKTGNIDEAINLEDLLVTDVNTSIAKAVKGIKSEQQDRDITTTPNITTDSKAKETPFTSGQAVSNAAKLGILHKVYIDTPEANLNPQSNTTITTSDVAQITPEQGYNESLKALTSLQQSEVVNSFNLNQRDFINNNYKDFISAAALIDSYSDNTKLQQYLNDNISKYSKTVLDILNNNSFIQQIQIFLNTKKPNGVGGQQPPNIQLDVVGYTNNINTHIKTPPTPGQGIIDVLTSLDTVGQPPNLISHTTEDWFSNVSNSTLGEELNGNTDLSGITTLLNNQLSNIIKQVVPNNNIQAALSLTEDIVNNRIKTPEEYANRLAALVGGDVSGYINYAQQALNIYSQVQQGNYTSLLGLPGVSNVLGSQSTAIASKVLGLISKKNITDKDIYDIAGSIFTSLTGIGIPLLDELAKLLGCVDSIKNNNPYLQDINNHDLQDIIDYLPRIIQTVSPLNRTKVLNITPSNCAQISILSAEEATINVKEIGLSYIKFELSNKELIRFNNNPLPDIGTPVNLYCEFYTDRITNKVLTPYKFTSQFTSNILEYKITNKVNNIYTAIISNSNIYLTLEDTINGSLYQYISKDVGDRLIPYILDSYILL